MSKSSLKKAATIALSVGTLGALLAGCGANTSVQNSTGNSTTGQTTGSKMGGSIVLDSTGNIKDLDPAKSYDTSSGEFVTMMYDQLVTYQGATSQIAPMLAKSWTVSPDGKTYTFNLVSGAKFWNGDPVTAQSFIDEFQRVLSKSVNSPGEGFLDPIVQGSTAYFNGTAKSVSGLSAPNPNTLVIKLTQPEPFFLEVLAMPFFSAVDQSWINKVGLAAYDSKSPMGSGPFEMTSSNITPNQLVLTKNPSYWRTDSQGNHLPYLDKVTVRINPNSNLDALNFEQGQTAFIGNLFGATGIPASQYPTFLNTPSLKSTMVNAPQNTTNYLGLNTSMAPFNNVKVRQAVEYAINKQKIKQLLNNRVQIADQPLPPGIKGYLNPLPADAQYSYDPAKAKQLLAAAGYPHGFSTTLYSQNDAVTTKLDNSIQNDLAQVGINVKINTMAWGTFLQENEKGNVTPMYMLAWIQDFPDASDFLNTLFNTNQRPQNNSSMYSNPQVDAWLNQAQTDTNTTQRYQLYAKATEQIMKDAPWVPLYYPNYNYAVQPWVHGFYINQSQQDPLEWVWIDQSHR